MGAIVASFGLCWVASVASADVVSLATLEARAISDNPSLEAREARVRAAAARIESIRAEMRPRLTLELGVAANPGAVVNGVMQVPTLSNEASMVPAGLFSSAVRFEGVLYDFGRTAARVRAGRAEAAATEADIEAAEEAIIRTVRVGYLSWLGASLRREATNSALEVAERRVADITRAVTAGARSEADKENASIELARMRLELSRARSAESVTRRMLARIVGAPIDEDALPDQSVLELAPPATSVPSDATARAFELRREAAQAGGRAYALRHAPVLSISLGIGATAQVNRADVTPPSAAEDDPRVYQADLSGLPTYTARLNLTVPLWDPRASSSVVDEAVAQAEALESAALDTQRTMDAAERDARARIEETEAEIVLAQEVVTGTAHLAEGVEERFRVSGGSFDAVLNAQERMRRAQDELTRSRLDRADAVLRLLPSRRAAD